MNIEKYVKSIVICELGKYILYSADPNVTYNGSEFDMIRDTIDSIKIIEIPTAMFDQNIITYTIRANFTLANSYVAKLDAICSCDTSDWDNNKIHISTGLPPPNAFVSNEDNLIYTPKEKYHLQQMLIHSVYNAISTNNEKLGLLCLEHKGYRIRNPLSYHFCSPAYGSDESSVSEDSIYDISDNCPDDEDDSFG